MKFYAYGLQYFTLRISLSKVIKFPMPYLGSLFVLLTWKKVKYNNLPIVNETIKKAHQLRANSIRCLSNGLIPPNLVANAKNIYKSIYVQSYCEYGALNFKKSVNITKYANIIIEMWRYGFSELTYNFHLNYGVDNSGEAHLLDIGELSFDKEEVKLCITNKTWREKKYFSDYEKDLDIRNIFETIVNLKNFELSWAIYLK